MATSVEFATVFATAFASVFSEMYNDATGSVKKYFELRNLKTIIKEMEVDFQQISKVRKLFSTDRVDLSSFYCPLDISYGKRGERKIVDCIDHISRDNNILIYGTAGQGKSMFMRNLAVNDWIIAERFPIFIELRYLNGDKNIYSLLSQHFKKIGFPELDDKMIIYILKTGKFSVFLDGVDEISRTFALTFKADFESLMGFCPKCRFVLSSRQGSLANLASKDSSLLEVKLAKIAPQQITRFLLKMGCSAEKADFLYAKLNEQDSGILNILNTPLLLDLFRHTYGTSGNIPNNPVEFYKQVFNTLVLHHDQAKDFYIRERATSLDNSQLQTAFEFFSFFSKEYGVSLDYTQFTECTDKARSLMNRSGVNYSFISEGLRTDFTEGLCLMVYEGPHVSFIHKNIQEFFAASCIAKITDNNLLKKIYESFYTNAKKEAEWAEELGFLKLLDNPRYEELYQRERNVDFLSYFDSISVNSLANELVNLINRIGFVVEIRVSEKKNTFLVVDAENINSIFIEILRKHFDQVFLASKEEKDDMFKSLNRAPGVKLTELVFAKRDLSKFDKLLNEQIITSKKFVEKINDKIAQSKATAFDLMLRKTQ